MKRRNGLVVLATVAASALSAEAQQLKNGTFESGALGWTNHPITSSSGWSITNADLDADKEVLFDAALLTNQSQGILFIQDVPTEQVDLQYGIALSADIGSSDLADDVRAFTKLEFGTNIAGSVGGSTLNDLTLSGEYDPALCATGTVVRRQVSLVKRYRDLTNDLAQAGVAIDQLRFVRSTLFLLNFGVHPPVPGSRAYYDNVSLGLVSRAYDAPAIPNGGFEFDGWTWFDNEVTESAQSRTYDRDGDGDKELEIDGSGLTAQYAGHLWVWEVDARMIDFSNNVSLIADIGATNLSPGLKAFGKMELGVNSPPNRGGSTIASFSGEYDPALYATNNDTHIGATVTLTPSALLGSLPEGVTPNDLTFVRVVLYLIQMNPAEPSASGQAWFDNVRLDFERRDRPNVTSFRSVNGAPVLTWSSQTNRLYRVQTLENLSDYGWTTLADGITGAPIETAYSITGTLPGAVTYTRVVHD